MLKLLHISAGVLGLFCLLTATMVCTRLPAAAAYFVLMAGCWTGLARQCRSCQPPL